MLSNSAVMTPPKSSLRSIGSAPRTRSWKSPSAIDWSTFTTPRHGVLGGEGGGDDPAHGVADDQRAVEALGRQHRGDVAGHRLAVVGGRQAGLAVAAHVDGDDGVVGGQVRDERVPRPPALGDPVHEHERRARRR